MRLAGFIARRYLFAKKSHNVINIISAISAIGMAIGTAALIIILSIYNGFDMLIKSMMSNVEPDLLITPASGKTFIPEGETYDWIYEQETVKNMCCTLQEQVFISYDGQQGLAQVKGVDWIYEGESPIRDHLREGDFTLHKGDILLNGHTHVCACREYESYVYMNPGSVSIPKEQTPHAYMTLEDGLFLWKDFSGEIFRSYRI